MVKRYLNNRLRHHQMRRKHVRFEMRKRSLAWERVLRVRETVTLFLVLALAAQVDGAGNLVPTPARADLTYNSLTGQVTLTPGQNEGIALFSLGSRNKLLNPFELADPNWRTDGSSSQRNGYLGDFGVKQPVSIGAVLPPGFDVAGLFAELSIASYTPGPVSPSYQFDLIVVPEPSTLSLAGVFTIGLALSRRRSRCSVAKPNCKPV